MSVSTARAPEPVPRVIVGVDGSALSHAAVAWAGRYADATGAHVTLVAVWDMHHTYDADLPLPDDYDPLADARQVAEQAREIVTLPAERVDVQVAHGSARTVLVEAARRADLLVVGSHGHSLVAGLLLGSVSAYCVRHATVPVVVVR